MTTVMVVATPVASATTGVVASMAATTAVAKT